jgi:hypothetical protein
MTEVSLIGIDPGTPEGDQCVLSAAVLACPFCGGPGCVALTTQAHPYAAAPKQEDYGDDGLSVRSVVFCHSCGSEGPDCEAELYTRDDYIDAKLQAITYWNKRGRHPELEVRGWEAM